MRGCRSVVITHSNLDGCREFWYHLLQSEGAAQNWVEAGPDFVNLVQTVRDLENDPIHAQRVARNAFDLFGKYLSEEAIDCYIQEFFHVYASVQGFKPNLEDNDAAMETYLLYPYEGTYPKNRLREYGKYPQLFKTS
jgi:hypothetical protein